eukprot:194773-Chlamydomonas_euryale.AAC.1
MVQEVGWAFALTAGLALAGALGVLLSVPCPLCDLVKGMWAGRGGVSSAAACSAAFSAACSAARSAAYCLLCKAATLVVNWLREL